ncbi:MAG: protease modulator HflC [Acidobacteriota bacterium]|nr:protease modulator HflC [Acidobacteriota bacterium]
MSPRKQLIFIAVVVLIAGILSSSLYVVQETEQVIITQFGKPVGEQINQAGLHWKLPFIEKVNRFDNRFLAWDGDRDEVPTKDKRFIWVDTYARWQITDSLLFFQRLRDLSGARLRLDDIIDGQVRDAIAGYNLVELVRTSNREPQIDESEPEESGILEEIHTGREEIRQEVLEKSRAKTEDLGIQILDIRFKRINYAEENVRRALEDRMIAERQRIAARYRSEGDGEASRIRGEKERELKRILSEAYRTAEEIRGRADAEATSIYANAYDQSTQARSFYEFMKSLETYEQTFDSETTLVLSTDGDFYRYLKTAGGP